MNKENQKWKFVGTVESMHIDKKEWLADHEEYILVDDYSFVYITEELLPFYILRWTK